MTLKEDHKQEIAALKDALEKPVVLVGLMGSGKTRLGRKLADALELDFYDTDRIIEEKAGYTINEIFTNDGEEKFRAVEKSTITELLEKGPCVVAGGGGVIMNEGVLPALKEKAVSVWLKTDVKELAQRLRNAQNRPLLKGSSTEEVLQGLLEKRESFYAQADVIIDTAGLQPQEAASRLIKGLCGFLKAGNL